MKAFLKIILVFVGGWIWFLLLEFVDKHTRQWKGVGLPDPLGIIAALGLSLGPWLLGYMVVLFQSWPPKKPRSILRWITCLILSAGLATASWLGGNVVRSALGYSPETRAPGPGDFSEQDVQSFITVGRPFEEITNRFGQPRLTGTNGQYLIWHFRSGLPETHPVKTQVVFGEKGYVFAGFNLWITNGRAAKWKTSDWEKIGN